MVKFQKLATEIKIKYKKSLLRKKCEILFENRIGSGDRFFGRDEYFNSVIVKSKENLKGMLKKVIITGGNQNTLFGEVLSKMKTTEFAA